MYQDPYFSHQRSGNDPSTLSVGSSTSGTLTLSARDFVELLAGTTDFVVAILSELSNMPNANDDANVNNAV